MKRFIQFMMLILIVESVLAQTDSTAVATVAAKPGTVEVSKAPKAQNGPKKAKKQKYKGPMPCASVNSHNGSLVPVGTYVYINKYFYVNKDEMISGTDVLDTPAMGYQNFSYQEVQNAFRTGVIKGIDFRLITSYFVKSMDIVVPKDTLGGTKTLTYTNSGLGDFKLIGRYSLMNQKKGPANVIVGLGVTIPVGTTDWADDSGNMKGGMQLGSGTWSPIFEFGVHKIKKNIWHSVYFSYLLSMEGELGPHEFKRSDVLKYNYAFAYALNKKLDVGVELNGEVKSEAEIKKAGTTDWVIVKNPAGASVTGGHTVFVSPEVHYKFSKKMHLSVCVPVVVYQDLNGPQFGGGSMIVTKFDVKF